MNNLNCNVVGTKKIITCSVLTHLYKGCVCIISCIIWEICNSDQLMHMCFHSTCLSSFPRFTYAFSIYSAMLKGSWPLAAHTFIAHYCKVISNCTTGLRSIPDCLTEALHNAVLGEVEIIFQSIHNKSRYITPPK